MAIFSGKIICYERSPENLRILRASLFTRGAAMIHGIYCQKALFRWGFSGEKVFGAARRTPQARIIKNKNAADGIKTISGVLLILLSDAQT